MPSPWSTDKSNALLWNIRLWVSLGKRMSSMVLNPPLGNISTVHYTNNDKWIYSVPLRKSGHEWTVWGSLRIEPPSGVCIVQPYLLWWGWHHVDLIHAEPDQPYVHKHGRGLFWADSATKLLLVDKYHTLLYLKHISSSQIESVHNIER